jgi:DNA-binding CsgD family transcriptional regulator
VRTSRMVALAALITRIDHGCQPEHLVRDIACSLFADQGGLACAVFLRMHSHRKEILTPLGSFGDFGSDTAAEPSLAIDQHTPLATALRYGKPLSLNAAQFTADFPQSPSLPPAAGGLLCLPFASHDVAVGAIQVLTREHVILDPATRIFVDGVSAAISLYFRATDDPWAAQGKPRPNLGLTARQQQILQLIALGASNHAIAARLGYSLSLIKLEVSRIFHSLGVMNREQAVTRARISGLIPTRNPDDVVLCRRIECRDRQ